MAVALDSAMGTESRPISQTGRKFRKRSRGLSRDLSDLPKKRRNSQPLHKNGKGYDCKTHRNNFLAPRNLSREAKRESQCQCSAQTAPEEHILVFHCDSK